jgi:hypothetical protein
LLRYLVEGVFALVMLFQDVAADSYEKQPSLSMFKT